MTQRDVLLALNRYPTLSIRGKADITQTRAGTSLIAHTGHWPAAVFHLVSQISP